MLRRLGCGWGNHSSLSFLFLNILVCYAHSVHVLYIYNNTRFKIYKDVAPSTCIYGL